LPCDIFIVNGIYSRAAFAATNADYPKAYIKNHLKNLEMDFQSLQV